MASIGVIARRVGVDAATVSRVLSGKAQPKYAPAIERADRIRKVALELGYQPNTAARATVSGRFHVASLLLSNRSHRSNLPMDLLNGIGDELEQHGIRLDLACLSDRMLTDGSYMPRVLRQRSSDGLLINYYAGIPQHMVELIEKCHLPVVWINVNRARDAVRPDDFGAAEELTARLIAAGHRRIAYLDLAFEIASLAGVMHYSKLDRQAGYLAAMAAAGLSAWTIHDIGIAGQPDSEEVVEALFAASAAPPEAIVCYGQAEAAVVDLIASRHGLAVPDDLETVTFRGSYRGPRCLCISAAVLPEEEMGREAVRMLLRKIEAPEKSLPSKILPCPLEAGATTRAGRAG